MKSSESTLLDVHKPPFFYTLDQLAQILNLDDKVFTGSYVYFAAPSNRLGNTKGKITARNISNDPDVPEWRVTDQEFLRWMKHKGFKPVSFWAYF